jgi:hypothetical protein
MCHWTGNGGQSIASEGGSYYRYRMCAIKKKGKLNWRRFNFQNIHDINFDANFQMRMRPLLSHEASKSRRFGLNCTRVVALTSSWESVAIGKDSFSCSMKLIKTSTQTRLKISNLQIVNENGTVSCTSRKERCFGPRRRDTL